VGKEKAMGNNKKAILIIDDDVSISRAFSRILERKLLLILKEKLENYAVL
jgi:GR25 family glycosyltransferase involved in LPS biosynthesis